MLNNIGGLSPPGSYPYALYFNIHFSSGTKGGCKRTPPPYGPVTTVHHLLHGSLRVYQLELKPPSTFYPCYQEYEF